MTYVWLIFILIVFSIVVTAVILTYAGKLVSIEIERNSSNTSSGYLHDLREQLILIRQIRRVILIVSALLLLGAGLYWAVHDTLMQGFVMEWLNLIIRWVHVVVGIMWIGASFYFIFLENNLNRTDGIRDELAGNLWAIHGGGFYFLEKRADRCQNFRDLPCLRMRAGDLHRGLIGVTGLPGDAV